MLFLPDRIEETGSDAGLLAPVSPGHSCLLAPVSPGHSPDREPTSPKPHTSVKGPVRTTGDSASWCCRYLDHRGHGAIPLNCSVYLRPILPRSTVPTLPAKFIHQERRPHIPMLLVTMVRPPTCCPGAQPFPKSRTLPGGLPPPPLPWIRTCPHCPNGDVPLGRLALLLSAVSRKPSLGLWHTRF